MIRTPKWQEEAVERGVFNLFYAKKHDFVIPLINALEKRSFKDRSLESVAIDKHLMKQHVSGIKGIVKGFHEHPAITSENMFVDWLILGSRTNRVQSFHF